MPYRGRSQVPSPVTEKWLPITKKNPRSFLWYTPFLARKAAPFLLYCAFLLNAKKVEKYWECKKKNLLKNSQKTFFSANKKIVPPLHPCYGSQKHHLPWRHLYPCTHRKKIIPPPSVKKAVPMCDSRAATELFSRLPFLEFRSSLCRETLLLPSWPPRRRGCQAALRAMMVKSKKTRETQRRRAYVGKGGGRGGIPLGWLSP